MNRVCPERPELFDGTPIGMYCCPVCLCIVVAGMAHSPHDADVCDLDEIPDEQFEKMSAAYARSYAQILDRTERPSEVGLPDGVVWVWLNGPVEPHWARRGTGLDYLLLLNQT